MIRLRRVITRLRPVLAAVGERVVLPVGVYILLNAAGVSEALALTGSAAVSAVLLAVGWLRTHSFNTLGILVLVRFALSLLLVGLTDDARLLLVKDAAITCLIGIAVLSSLLLRGFGHMLGLFAAKGPIVARLAVADPAAPKPLLIDSKDSLSFDLFSARWIQAWLSRLGRLPDLVRR